MNPLDQWGFIQSLYESQKTGNRITSSSWNGRTLTKVYLDLRRTHSEPVGSLVHLLSPQDQY